MLRYIAFRILMMIPTIFAISFITLLFTWVLAFPIGVYSAVRPYSLLDYVFTFIGFIGLATPGFLLALVLLVVAFDKFGMSVGGLFSPPFENAPWTLARL